MSKRKSVSLYLDRDILHRVRSLPTMPYAREVALSRIVEEALTMWLAKNAPGQSIAPGPDGPDHQVGPVGGGNA